MICRFLNASTADGYNPYRLTRNGFDWEVLNPDDPWSYIGYWGDHQIIYLLKLLEILQRQDPATLRQFLTRDIFAFANVPYRIKPYEDLVANPKGTVVFDHELQKLIEQRVTRLGADGKLIWDDKSEMAGGSPSPWGEGRAGNRDAHHPRCPAPCGCSISLKNFSSRSSPSSPTLFRAQAFGSTRSGPNGTMPTMHWSAMARRW